MRLEPASTAEVATYVRDAADANAPLAVEGTGTRRGIGPAVAARGVLSLARLSGIVDYDPAELVLTARAGTPLAEVAAAVAAAGQHLAWEPPDHAPLWGGAAGAGTIGGALAVGWGGPRRPWAGAPRDHFLGLTAVNGSGEVFSAGGKVIKNVTGYDLPKLLAGSFGTLAVLTEITVKTLPAPRASVTVAVEGLSDAAAVAAMTRAAASHVAVTGAAHLPAADGRPAATVVRIEGAALDARAAAVAAAMGEGAVIADADWAAIGAVHRLVPPDAALWRIVVPPAGGAVVAARLPAGRYYFDWAGGLIWLAVADDGDAQGPAIRAAVGGDGHATLVRGNPAARNAAFPPLTPALAALEERVRARFDPARVLNPGRRVAV